MSENRLSQGEEYPLLTVMIATHDRAEALRDTLGSLAEATLPEGYCETVVVENAPAQLKCRYVHSPLANKSEALNEALKDTQPGLVVFFDDDVLIGGATLSAYAAAARRFGKGHFFGGRLVVRASGESGQPWLLQRMPPSVQGFSRGDEEFVGSRLYALGANWAAWTEDLEGAGYFNPHFGPGSWTRATGQESEMQVRLFRRGVLSVYVPDSEVTHAVAEQSLTETWLLRRIYRNAVRHALLANSRRVLWSAGRKLATALIATVTWPYWRLIAGRRDVAFDARAKTVEARGYLRGALINVAAFLKGSPVVEEPGLPGGDW